MAQTSDDGDCSDGDYIEWQVVEVVDLWMGGLLLKKQVVELAQ